MKIFISWSGERSRGVAELLNNWIRCVLQAARPWVSTQNIDRGAVWFGEIQRQLQDTAVGIVCLTQENKTKPWILFEAGALAKGLSASRVCTFLVDLAPADVENPLAQFNHTVHTKDSLWQLVRTLNSCLPAEQMLHEQVLERVFDTYWPQFDAEFQRVVAANPPAQPVPEREQKDILSEILENTRSLTGRVGMLEKALQSTDRLRKKLGIQNLDTQRLGDGSYVVLTSEGVRKQLKLPDPDAAFAVSEGNIKLSELLDLGKTGEKE
jgi:hypothetical protein